MINLGLKRVQTAIEELEKRVYKLEAKVISSQGTSEIFQTVKDIPFSSSNNVKFFDFIGLKRMGAIIKIKISSSIDNQIYFNFYHNDVLKKHVNGNCPIEVELDVITEIGNNRITVEALGFTDGETHVLSFDVSIVGFADNQPIEPHLGYVGDNFLYLVQGDTIKCIDSSTMQTRLTSTGNDDADMAYYEQDFLVIMKRKGEDVLLERYDKAYKYYSCQSFKDKFTDCAITCYDGYIDVIYVKSNYLYHTACFMYSPQYITQKLPIKAKSVRAFVFNSIRYLLYKSLTDNYFVVSVNQSVSFKAEKTYSIGKVENANLCLVDGTIYVTYKQGNSVMKRKLDFSDEPTLLGVGDEGVITGDGSVIIRRGDELIKL